ncbi:MAG: tetratricopeptide repeat protein [bacterium]
MKNFMTDYFKKILIAFFISAAFFILFSYAVIFGIIPESLKYSHINLRFLISSGMGNFVAFSVIAIMVSAGCIIFFDLNKIIKSFAAILFLFYFYLLIIIDSPAAWIALIISSLAGSYLKYIWRESFRKDAAPYKNNSAAISGIYFFTICLSFIFLFISNSGFTGILGSRAKERASWFRKDSSVNLKLSDNAKILSGSFKDNWFLGTGQAAFIYSFSKYTKGIISNIFPNNMAIGASEFNNGAKWIRFYSSGNHIFDLIATGGILAILTYFGLIAIFFVALIYVAREDNSKESGRIYFIGFIAASIIFSRLFLVNNITIIFFECIFFAFLMVEAKNISPRPFPVYSISKDETVQRAHLKFFFPLFTIGYIITIALILLVGVKAYHYRIADKKYKEFLGEDIDRLSAKNKIDEAVALNPFFEGYTSASAAYLLADIKETLKNEKALDNIKYDAAKSIELVKKNTINHPYSAGAWEIQGDVYKAVSPFVKEGASEWILKSYKKAEEFEPSNPRFAMELGKAYLLEATKDGVDNAGVNKAIECFNRIINSCREKGQLDFFDEKMVCLDEEEATVNLAKALEAKGQKSHAIEELNKMDSISKPSYESDPKVLFELGRLYFNNNDLDKAIEILDVALELDPNYSNALYALSAVYEKKGENEKAVLLLKKVLELNPESKEIQEKIEKLK